MRDTRCRQSLFCIESTTWPVFLYFWQEASTIGVATLLSRHHLNFVWKARSLLVTLLHHFTFLLLTNDRCSVCQVDKCDDAVLPLIPQTASRSTNQLLRQWNVGGIALVIDVASKGWGQLLNVIDCMSLCRQWCTSQWRPIKWRRHWIEVVPLHEMLACSWSSSFALPVGAT